MTATTNNISKLISKQLKQKALDFLESRKCANNLVDIIQNLELCINNQTPVSSHILTLEHLFSELLKRKELCIEFQPLKPKDTSPETQYREWLQQRFKESLELFYVVLNHDKNIDSCQALVSTMKLLILEAKYPFENINEFPLIRFRSLIKNLLSYDKLNTNLFIRFQEYVVYHDILDNLWKVILSLTPKRNSTNTSIFIRNFLDLVNAAIPASFNEQLKKGDTRVNCIIYNEQLSNYEYDYIKLRKNINKTWNYMVLWNTDDEYVHRQLLTVLLEKILPHLDKPLLLTDLLMESLDVGGPISLLSLQGIFILIQHHNLTYPDIYEKLYSMFEPEILHTKFKARLFYLADIFLTSSHLPETLIAAFIKRLSRLTLIATPQDIVIILYFIGNLILRHPGLKRMLCHTDGCKTIPNDPYIMDERKPTESKAIESSLWEIAALQYHNLPSISTAAKFISNPLPTQEWDLSSVLELNENDIFDQEMMRKFKNCPINFDKIDSMFLPKDDKIKKYWKLV